MSFGKDKLEKLESLLPTFSNPEKLEMNLRLALKTAKFQVQSVRKKADDTDKREGMIRTLLKRGDVESAKRLAVVVVRDKDSARKAALVSANIDTLQARIKELVAEKNILKLHSETQESLFVISIVSRTHAFSPSLSTLVDVLGSRYPSVRRGTVPRGKKEEIQGEYETTDPTETEVYDLFDKVWNVQLLGERPYERPKVIELPSVPTPTKPPIMVTALSPDGPSPPPVPSKDDPPYRQRTVKSQPASPPNEVEFYHPDPQSHSTPEFPSLNKRASVAPYLQPSGPPVHKSRSEGNVAMAGRGGAGAGAGRSASPARGYAPQGESFVVPQWGHSPPRTLADITDSLSPLDAAAESAILLLPFKLQSVALELLSAIREGDPWRGSLVLARERGGKTNAEWLGSMAGKEAGMVAGVAREKGLEDLAFEIERFISPLPSGIPPEHPFGEPMQWSPNVTVVPPTPGFEDLDHIPSREPSPEPRPVVDLPSVTAQIRAAVDGRDAFTVDALVGMYGVDLAQGAPEWLGWCEEVLRTWEKEGVEGADWALASVQQIRGTASMEPAPPMVPEVAVMGRVLGPANGVERAPSPSPSPSPAAAPVLIQPEPQPSLDAPRPRPRVSSRVTDGNTSPVMPARTVPSATDEQSALEARFGNLMVTEVSPPSGPRTGADVAALFPDPPATVPGGSSLPVSWGGQPVSGQVSRGFVAGTAGQGENLSLSASAGAGGADLDELRRMLAQVSKK